VGDDSTGSGCRCGGRSHLSPTTRELSVSEPPVYIPGSTLGEGESPRNPSATQWGEAFPKIGHDCRTGGGGQRSAVIQAGAEAAGGGGRGGQGSG